jgi:thiamine biosynthesis lipoprotein
MGSDAHVIVTGDRPDLVIAARHRIEQLEQRWSRFLPGSEISDLNRHAGSFRPVSADTLLLIERAIAAWRLTGASFDPTVLGDVIRAGYDRPFDQLGAASAARRSLLLTGCADIEIDGSCVRLPGGTGFDPGGIGKGLAADVVAGEAMAAGAGGVCINLGGDLRVRGDGPHGGPWTVAVEHPWADGPLALLGLADGAVATSTTLLRRWLVEGEVRHHLIDPATGRPSTTDLAHVTVVAAEAWAAEVLAKAVLLRGATHPFDLIDGDGAEALVVDAHGALSASAGFASYLGGSTLPATIALAEGCLA